MKIQVLKKNSIYLGMLAAILALFLMSNSALAQRSVTRSSSSSSNDGRTRTMTYKTGRQSLNVEYEGDIEFTDDDKAIKSISRGGYLYIRKTRFGDRVEITAEPNNDGTIAYEYREGRRVREWDQKAQEFLADVLLQVIQTTGLGAESRVKRFYDKGGVDAVLEEVDNIKGDHVSHIYLKTLVYDYDLSDNDLVKIAAYVPRNLDSDHYIAEVLMGSEDKFFKSEATTKALLSAIDRMDSDHYVTMILRRALQNSSDEAVLKNVLDASRNIDSDHYKTELLGEMLRADEINDQIVDNVIEQVAYIDSDHYATMILTRALKQPNLSDAAFDNLMAAVENIDSDHYVTQTFRSILNKRDVSEKVIETVIDKLSYMDSDHYRTIIISDLLNDRKISEQYFESLIETIGDIDSDHYASQMLSGILNDQNLSNENFNTVLRRVSSMDSDHYISEVLRRLGRKDLSEEQLESVLNATDRIDSDHYKTEVLRGLCSTVSESSEKLKDLFRDVARGIESDTYYGRVARCLD